ncbi:MAG TPA: hypothetical protein VM577_14835 [Anaerovoracaceae bacterium]|nr:hypothetical protein [Anaerovoracaceae bacterium]
MNLSDEEIKLIEEHRKQKAFDAWEPATFESLSQELKNEMLEGLYNYALEIYNHVKEHGCAPKDCEHYGYEKIMELIGPANDPQEIWSHYNKINKGR